MYTGTPLSERKINIAFRIAEEIKEKVFLYGDSAKGWDGIVNNPNIPVQSLGAGNSNLAALTALETFDFVNTIIGGAWEGTNAVRICDTLLMPMEDLVTLGRPMANDQNTSIFKYIQENNIYTRRTGRQLMIRELRQLKGAAGGVLGTADENRYIAYPRDMMVLRYHVPQELQFTQPQREGLGWTYYGSLVLAGLEIMEPDAMRYADGCRLMPPTLGEQRVVHDFNASGENRVDELKSAGAKLIDDIAAIPDGNSQCPRWKAEAMTLIETGVMFAVKAATAGAEVMPRGGHHAR